jgi:hypothetical protein
MNVRYSFLLIVALAGCDQLGLETPAVENARAEAEGKAMGSACRQGGRALEDCYQINAKASKAAIFTGWREMDAYMRENKIEEVKPQFPMKPGGTKKRPLEAATEEPEAAAKKDAHGETKAAEPSVEAKPADSKHGEAKPGDAKPAETKPAAPKTEEKPPLKKSSLPGHRTT